MPEAVLGYVQLSSNSLRLQVVDWALGAVYIHLNYMQYACNDAGCCEIWTG